MENQTQGVNLEIVDLQNATNIMKAAIERGGVFSADEMVDVTAVYAKFASFLKAVAEQQAAAQAAAQEEGAGEESAPVEGE